MTLINVKYGGKTHLVMPVEFSNEPTVSYDSGQSSHKLNYQSVLDSVDLNRRPTPAELSYQRKFMQDEHKITKSPLYLNGVWSAHGVGISDSKSRFRGKPIIAVVNSVNLWNNTAMPDYERSVELDGHILYGQKSGGFIERWDVVGEYDVNGEKHFFAIPITGVFNHKLGSVDLRLWGSRFLPLAVGSSIVPKKPRYTTQLSYEVISRGNPREEHKEFLVTSPKALFNALDERVINALKRGELKIAARLEEVLTLGISKSDGTFIFDSYPTKEELSYVLKTSKLRNAPDDTLDAMVIEELKNGRLMLAAQAKDGIAVFSRYDSAALSKYSII